MSSFLSCRISLWHQQQLMGDVFLGQIHLSLSSLSLNGPHPPHSYQAWYSLCPRSEYSPLKIGSVRLLLIYHEDYILTSTTYQPLLNLLVNSITESVSMYMYMYMYMYYSVLMFVQVTVLL